MSLPNHIALIPDGNRRWAKNRLLPAFMGHQAGAEMTEKVFEAALKAGIKHLTFWGASISNVTKRAPAEVAFLYELFERYFKKLAQSKIIADNQVRVRVLGSWEQYFPESLKQVLREVVAATEHYTGRHLTFLLAYNGTDEMLQAVTSLKNQGGAGAVDAAALKQRLFTHDLPPVDLVIRTGCDNDPHISAGFMMWDTAEAQLYFTNKQWPDFTPQELEQALADYADRERRLGA